MRKVLILVVCLVAASGAALALKWDEMFGDSDPVRKVGRVDTSVAPPLPDVVQEKIPVHAILARTRRGTKSNITKGVADALQTLAIEAKLDISKLNILARQKKVHFDALIEMEGIELFSVEDIEALGETGAVDKGLLKTILRDKQVPLEAIKALGKIGTIPSQYVGPFEVIAEAGQLPLDEFHVIGDQLMIETDRLLAGTRPIRAIEVTDKSGDHIRIDRDEASGRWIIPSRFGAPATYERMRMVCRALDGLGRSESRGRRASRHSVYEVDGDDGMRVRLEDEQGETVVDLRVGKQDSSNNRSYRTTGNFVRPVGSDVVYRHPRSLITLAQARYNIWVDLRYVDYDYETINTMVQQLQKITLEYDDVKTGPDLPNAENQREHSGERKRFVLECAETERPAADQTSGPAKPQLPGEGDTVRTWAYVEPEALKSEELHTPMVDNIARLILNGRKEDIVGIDPDNEKYGFETPLIDATMTFDDGKSYVFKIGARIPVEGAMPAHLVHSRYATLSGDPFVLKVSEHTCTTLMKRPSDFKDPAQRGPDRRGLKPGSVVPSGRPKILDPEERKADDGKKKADDGKKKADGDKKKADGDKLESEVCCQHSHHLECVVNTTTSSTPPPCHHPHHSECVPKQK